MLRFTRTEQLLGEEMVERLAGAGVVVCGLGAVGSFAVEALARAGVGRLRLVDYDRVSLSNINRQLYALSSTVEMKKARVARERVLDINPACEVEILDTFIDENSIESVLAGSVDVVVDAIDSLSSKVHLIKNALDKGLHVVSSMGAAGKLDANAILTGDISKTHTCPLARSVRRRLHRMEIREGVTCVYSTEAARNKRPSVCGEEPAFDGNRTAPVIGSISYITAIFGLKAAYEAIGFILNRKEAMEMARVANG